MNKSISRNSVDCYQVWNPPLTFYGENLIFENCLWWRNFSIETQDHSLQPLTLLMFA